MRRRSYTFLFTLLCIPSYAFCLCNPTITIMSDVENMSRYELLQVANEHMPPKVSSILYDVDDELSQFFARKMSEKFKIKLLTPSMKQSEKDYYLHKSLANCSESVLFGTYFNPTESRSSSMKGTFLPKYKASDIRMKSIHLLLQTLPRQFYATYFSTGCHYFPFFKGCRTFSYRYTVKYDPHHTLSFQKALFSPASRWIFSRDISYVMYTDNRLEDIASHFAKKNGYAKVHIESNDNFAFEMATDRRDVANQRVMIVTTKKALEKSALIKFIEQTGVVVKTVLIFDPC